MATKKLRVYISAPITIDKDHYEDNFYKYAALINANNYEDDDGTKVYPYEAVNPIEYKQDCWKDVDGAKDKFSKGCWEQFIIKDIELLATCDAIVLFPGWEHSYGCTIEYLAARRMGKHVILDSGLEKDYDFTLAHLLDHWSNFVLQGANECYLDNSKWEDKLRSTINGMLEEAKEREDDKVTDTTAHYYVYYVLKSHPYKTHSWYVVHEVLTDKYYQCDAAYNAAWILKGSEKKSFLNKLKNGKYVEVDAAHIEGDALLWEKALKKDKWTIYEKGKIEAAKDEVPATDECKRDVEVDDETFDEAYEEDVDDNKWKKLKREVKASPKLFQIGDIVRPTEEALKRNKEFTTDRRFIVTGEQDSALEDDQPVWYDLATKGSYGATYCLPSNELTLVQRTAWKQYQD